MGYADFRLTVAYLYRCVSVRMHTWCVRAYMRAYATRMFVYECVYVCKCLHVYVRVLLSVSRAVSINKFVLVSNSPALKSNVEIRTRVYGYAYFSR